MVKRMLLMMATALMVVACAGVEDVVRTPEDTRPAEPQTVSFGAYVNRSTTRGGYQGTLSLESLKLDGVGFGVFAYYTDNHVYSQTMLPNFMYNQQVTWDGTTSSWTYTPIKYWPNETGDNGATTTDRLSFFAYAPYTAVDISTGRATTNPTSGIVALTRPSDSGDPVVRYYASWNPSEAVDLCWSNTNNFDKTKPALSETVSFNFQHALSALNVQIDADVDEAAHDGSNDVDSYTRIYVRSITFRGFADRGQLNLNNTETTPRWNNLDCDCDLTSDAITIYDGRRDDREGIAASLNETKVGLNPVIVQSVPYTLDGGSAWGNIAYVTAGVTNTSVNLFNSSTASAPIFVIPTNEPLYVTIVYDVETYDPKLTSQYLSDGRTHGSTIENNLSAYIKNGSSENIIMQAGKQYNIRLHLGMTSVKVDASVTKWPDTGTSADVEVPK